jgi:hypothetical protein
MVNYYIHVEKAWHEQTWKNLLEFTKTHKCCLFLMPIQFFYQCSVLGYRGTEAQLKKILKKRYKQLSFAHIRYEFEVGMHIHLSLRPEELPEKEKEEFFNKSRKWLSRFFPIFSVSFGWFKSCNFLRNLCEKEGIEIKHYAPFTINIHDYDLPVSKFKLLENFIKDNLRRWLRKQNDK